MASFCATYHEVNYVPLEEIANGLHLKIIQAHHFSLE